MKPASVGPRIGAALIDIALISLVSYVICIPVFRFMHFDEKEKILERQLFQMQQDPLSVDPSIVQSLMGFTLVACGLALLLLIAMHAYYVYFETTSGQTPGKKILGLRVVDLEGRPITQKQAVYREILRWYFDGLFIFPAFIAMYATSRRQRVGDIVAKTMVIDVKTRGAIGDAEPRPRA
jgi:uncharacterized RDD family membrane protein YckC